MELKQLQKNWDTFGKQDPLWAILTVPTKKNGKWDLADFFKAGDEEIDEVLRELENLEIPAIEKKTALDFGCGVGRLTQALCKHFEHCHGVDIAPSMVELAKKYNKHDDRCQYHLNDKADLTLFEDNTFNFIYSMIVLQHIAPRFSEKYIEEFIRVLKPGGLIIFQLPSEIDSTNILPDSAFKAHLSIEKMPNVAKAHTLINIEATIKNESNIMWLTKAQPSIRLGGYWLTESGQRFSVTELRVDLPKDLLPNEQVTVSFKAITPLIAGVYRLELDLVQEVIAWFKDKGSQPVQGTITIQPASLITRSKQIGKKLITRFRQKSDSPVMEMHGIPKEKVLECINSLGGKVVHIKPDKRAGQAWLSFVYYVTK